MRILFIPGFGEDESIFEHLHPVLPGEKEFLSLWNLLPNKNRRELNVSHFARELVEHFGIKVDDLIIGHSTGGWVALHIKNLVPCRVVQIASWTDSRKVIKPVANRHLLYFAVRSGLYINSFTLRWTLKKQYDGKLSREVFRKVFAKLMKGNKANVVNQLRLIFNPVDTGVTVAPDLVIHAKGDSIIRFPDGPVHEVPGDHFSLYTHPNHVAQPILNFLNHGFKV